MSRLLGPLSVTTSTVSWRDWAWAGDHTAGAGNRLPAATAVIDLRNSRRFMAASARVRWGFTEESAKPMPAPRRALAWVVSHYGIWRKAVGTKYARPVSTSAQHDVLRPNPRLHKN